MSGQNVVFIGAKPVAVYLARVVTLLASGSEVRIVARGRFIRKAVTVAVRAIKATGCDYKVILDEEVLSADEGERRVPRIEIILTRKSS